MILQVCSQNIIEISRFSKSIDKAGIQFGGLWWVHFAGRLDLRISIYAAVAVFMLLVKMTFPSDVC